MAAKKKQKQVTPNASALRELRRVADAAAKAADDVSALAHDLRNTLDEMIEALEDALD